MSSSASTAKAALEEQLRRDQEQDHPQAAALAAQLSNDKRATWCFNCGENIPGDADRMAHECWS
jgi:hypothetical protein